MNAPATHADRAHATWSASATERNWNCSGALALTKDLPERTNPAAEWGTCCHEIAELCLRDGLDAADFIGRTYAAKESTIEVDEEMAETAQTYVDYVRDRLDAAGEDAQLLIEQKFSLASLNPPFDAGGTCDAIIYAPSRKHLEVIDLKGGRGVVVDAIGNKQMRTYGLGAMMANPEWSVLEVTTTIVQPRAPHKDGRIRSETISTVELIDWTWELREAIGKAKEALDARQHMDFDAWAEKYLVAGDHCKFCGARPTCPAIERKVFQEVGLWFDDLGEPKVSDPRDLTPEEIARKLDLLDMIGDWCNAVRAYAHERAEAGDSIPGYTLVEKIGNRAWAVPEAEVVARLRAAGVENPYQQPKVMTPAQADKALGKKKEVIADIIVRPSRGTNLVAADKTSRPAIAPAAERFFDKLD